MSTDKRIGSFSIPGGLRLLVFSVAAWGAAACATAPPLVEHHPRGLFKAPTFDMKLLQGRALAVLPVAHTVPDGIRNNAAYELAQAVGRRFPSLHLVPASELVARAKQANILGDLERLISGYEQRGTIDRPILRKIVLTQDSRYLLYPRVVRFETRNEEESAEAAMPRQAVRSERIRTVNRVELEAEIWDGECGTRVWSASTVAQSVEDPADARIRIEDLFVQAANDLAGLLPEAGKNGQAQEMTCL